MKSIEPVESSGINSFCSPVIAIKDADMGSNGAVAAKDDEQVLVVPKSVQFVARRVWRNVCRKSGLIGPRHLLHDNWSRR
jgi:hypothetical protein